VPAGACGADGPGAGAASFRSVASTTKITRYATALDAMIVHVRNPIAAAVIGTAMRNAASTTVLGPKTRRIPEAYGPEDSVSPPAGSSSVDEVGGGGGGEAGGVIGGSDAGGAATGASETGG
jgi:hypothetical protein